MGLHLYVGPLCRYYGGDRPRGALGKIVSFFKPNPASPERIRAWRDGLGARGCFGSVTDWNWPESLDLDYVTDKPSADGWGAARLWAAYAEQPQLTAPRELAGDWEQDPVLAAAADFEQIHRPELWLPVEFDNVFEAEEVSGARSRIGSVYALDRQLRRLHPGVSKWIPMDSNPRRVGATRSGFALCGPLSSGSCPCIWITETSRKVAATLRNKS